MTSAADNDGPRVEAPEITGVGEGIMKAGTAPVTARRRPLAMLAGEGRHDRGRVPLAAVAVEAEEEHDGVLARGPVGERYRHLMGQGLSRPVALAIRVTWFQPDSSSSRAIVPAGRIRSATTLAAALVIHGGPTSSRTAPNRSSQDLNTSLTRRFAATSWYQPPQRPDQREHHHLDTRPQSRTA